MRSSEFDPFNREALSVQLEPSLRATYNSTANHWETVRKVPGRAARSGHQMLNRDVLEEAPAGTFEGDQVRRILHEHGQLGELETR